MLKLYHHIVLLIDEGNVLFFCGNSSGQLDTGDNMNLLFNRFGHVFLIFKVITHSKSFYLY